MMYLGQSHGSHIHSLTWHQELANLLHHDQRAGDYLKMLDVMVTN